MSSLLAIRLPKLAFWNTWMYIISLFSFCEGALSVHNTDAVIMAVPFEICVGVKLPLTFVPKVNSPPGLVTFISTCVEVIAKACIPSPVEP